MKPMTKNSKLVTLTFGLLFFAVFVGKPSPGKAATACESVHTRSAVREVAPILERYHDRIAELRLPVPADRLQDVAKAASALAGQVSAYINQNSAPPQGLKAMSMKYDYIGEQFGQSIHFGEVQIPYFTITERQERQITFRNGFAYWPGGQMVNRVRKAEFIIGLDGQFYMTKRSDEKREPRVRHSSFFQGEPVLAAGQITFDSAARVQMINRRSGHYKPSPADLDRVLRFLQQQGIFVRTDAVNDSAPN